MEASSPRRAKKINSFCNRSHNKDSKNPYSKRGLDKFSALLADIEEKKQQIYSHKGSEDISLVRFVYKDLDDCVPIVVKVKKEKTKSAADDIKETTIRKLSRSLSDDKIAAKKNNFSWNEMKSNHWRRPSYYLPAATILILLFLVFFGRSFAILCTSIGWYIVPVLQGEKSSNDISQEKKKKMKTVCNESSSPKRSNNGGAVKVQSQSRGLRGNLKSP